MTPDQKSEALTALSQAVEVIDKFASWWVAAVKRGSVPPEGAGEPRQSEYEYRTTTGPRKAWDGEPDLTKEGWEPDPDRGRPGESWERFDYHEEAYWRRKRGSSPQPDDNFVSDGQRELAARGYQRINNPRGSSPQPGAGEAP